MTTRPVAAGLLLACTLAVGCAPTPMPGASLDPAPRVVGVPDVAVDDAGRKYNRDEWKHWTDEDGDGCNTRCEVLIAESVDERGNPFPVTFSSPGTVRTGRWVSRFTGAVITDARQLQVDHLVSLADAHRSGGWAWNASDRERYANELTDPRHLVAVESRVNAGKGDSGPDEWLPADRERAAAFVRDYCAVKARWRLTVTAAQAESIRLLGGC